MPKLLIAFASATLLLASSGIWKTNAATIASPGTLAPLSPMRPLKQLPTATDTPAEPIAGHITAMATDAHITATPTGRTAITATAGDRASPSVSDEVGAGATSLECKPLCSHEARKGNGESRASPPRRPKPTPPRAPETPC